MLNTTPSYLAAAMSNQTMQYHCRTVPDYTMPSRRFTMLDVASPHRCQTLPRRTLQMRHNTHIAKLRLTLPLLCSTYETSPHQCKHGVPILYHCRAYFVARSRCDAAPYRTSRCLCVTIRNHTMPMLNHTKHCPMIPDYTAPDRAITRHDWAVPHYAVPSRC